MLLSSDLTKLWAEVQITYIDMSLSLSFLHWTKTLSQNIVSSGRRRSSRLENVMP
jgi:hypothetical protein